MRDVMTRRRGSSGSARAHHRILASSAGMMAGTAVAGAVGLVGGGISFGGWDAVIRGRLPWHSTTVAGVALAVTVAVPTGTTAVMAWRGAERSDTAALVAGTALVSWIVAESTIIRVYSWMQPACLVYGLAIAGMGWQLRRARLHGAPADTTTPVLPARRSSSGRPCFRTAER